MGLAQIKAQLEDAVTSSDQFHVVGIPIMGTQRRKMKVETKVEIYKTNIEEHRGLERPVIVVKSVAQYSKMVTLEIDGKRYEVPAADMQKAITNALNC